MGRDITWFRVMDRDITFKLFFPFLNSSIIWNFLIKTNFVCLIILGGQLSIKTINYKNIFYAMNNWYFLSKYTVKTPRCGKWRNLPSYDIIWRLFFSIKGKIFEIFFRKSPWLTNTVKGCTKVNSFYSNVKNSSAAIPGSVTPKDFDLSSGTYRYLN